MQIDKKYKLEKCVSDDPSRSNLQNVFVSRRHAFSTNGHVLAIVPVKSEKGDTPGWLTPEAMKLGRKEAKGSDTITISLNGQLILPGGMSLPRPNGEEKPPRFFRVIRRALSNRKIRVGLNVGYLKDLADALGTDEITLEIDKPDSSILVRPVHSGDGALGVFMPIRLNSH
jgi:hypothetical protein